MENSAMPDKGGLVNAGKAEVAMPMPQPTSPLTATMASALVGATAALAVVLIKEYFDRQKEKRTKKESEAEIYRHYLTPLAESCEKIVWRAREIFIDRRHAFLKTATLPLDFNDYKRTSTLYRIASLIGWIRGMGIELRALPRAPGSNGTPISGEIIAFQRALAEGTHVEQHRLDSLAALWGFDLSDLDARRRAELGLQFEIEAHKLTDGRLKSTGNELRTLRGADKHRICEALITFLQRTTGRQSNPASLDDDVIDQAIQALSYREALLYRDWQDALGDAMIESDPLSDRRFRIIGYDAFTKLLLLDKPWFKVFAHSIDDIDFDEANPLDSRAQQLRDVCASVANILIAISKTEDGDLVGAATLETAKELAATLPLQTLRPSGA
jgi:hypothetical protein